MTDFLTKEERSHRMSLIRSKNTKPERQMARMLRRSGIRFRRQLPLPGRPDFVLLGTRIAVFVDSDFWHGRHYEKLKPKLTPGFWRDKIANNRRRDRRVSAALRGMGWTVLRFWETDMRRRPDLVIARVCRHRFGTPTASNPPGP